MRNRLGWGQKVVTARAFTGLACVTSLAFHIASCVPPVVAFASADGHCRLQLAYGDAILWQPLCWTAPLAVVHQTAVGALWPARGAFPAAPGSCGSSARYWAGLCIVLGFGRFGAVVA